MLKIIDRIFYYAFGRVQEYTPELHYSLRSKLSFEHAEVMGLNRPFWMNVVCSRFKDLYVLAIGWFDSVKKFLTLF